MNSVELKLVTILSEPEIADRLIEDIRALGARGYSLSEGSGEWRRGLGGDERAASDWHGPNIRIETVVSQAIAEAILGHLAKTYFPHYAIFAYVSPVAVARLDRYL